MISELAPSRLSPFQSNRFGVNSRNHSISRSSSQSQLSAAVDSLRLIADAYDECRSNPDSPDKIKSVQSAYAIYRINQEKRVPPLKGVDGNGHSINLRMGAESLVIESSTQHDINLPRRRSIPIRQLTLKSSSNGSTTILHDGKIVCRLHVEDPINNNNHILARISPSPDERDHLPDLAPDNVAKTSCHHGDNGVGKPCPIHVKNYQNGWSSSQVAFICISTFVLCTVAIKHLSPRDCQYQPFS
uniref:Uncharacterized protein n=1 Tax=Spongospora subterranea TaxID=70186 RepID=A0A0H5QGS5_9EUKA|eukprot:CRZ00792.1 hypothetical protein [Spongospora subterranea]